MTVVVINYLLNDDNVVCTLQDAKLYTLARLSTVMADFARIAAKHMNRRAASKPAHPNPSPPPLTTNTLVSQIRIFLSQVNFFPPLNKTGGGSSSDGNTILLTAEVESAQWHVAGRERSPRE